MEGRPRSQPDDLINFRQLRSNALQAAELDIYDGDDIRLVGLFLVSLVSFYVCARMLSRSQRFCCSRLLRSLRPLMLAAAAAVVVVALKPVQTFMPSLPCLHSP